jgi:RNA polymerase sigma-70 factor (ECF subfamily)
MDAHVLHSAVGRGWDWQQLGRLCLHEAQGVLGHTALAQDAAQEALARAWRHRGSCRDSDPGAWVRTIARREALRLACSEPLCVPLDAAALADRPAPTGDEPEVASALRRLIAGLPELDRQLLFMQHWQDVPVVDIARQLSMPVGTVKIRLHRVRARLRHALERSVGDAAD